MTPLLAPDTMTHFLSSSFWRAPHAMPCDWQQAPGKHCHLVCLVSGAWMWVYAMVGRSCSISLGPCIKQSNQAAAQANDSILAHGMEVCSVGADTCVRTKACGAHAHGYCSCCTTAAPASVHGVVVGVQNRAPMHVDGGDPDRQLMHARLPQHNSMRVQQPLHQRAALAWLEACRW